MRLLEAIAAEPSFLQVVVMGLVTVFVVLICLIILIKIMGSLMGGRASAPAPAPAQGGTAAPPEGAVFEEAQDLPFSGD